jgi:acetyl-CoA hydrolase
VLSPARGDGAAPPAIDLSRLLRPGDTVAWGQSQAEPGTLIRTLVEQRHAFGRIRVFLGIGLGGIIGPEHADAIDFVAYCGSGANRRLADAGVLDILPVHYSQLPSLIGSGALRIDAVLLQVSQPDEQGRHSLGMARDYLIEAMRRARVVIGEVRADVPWTHGGPYLAQGDFDLLVSSDCAVAAEAPATIGPVEAAIGRNVAGLIEDGATLQTGIGGIPDAVLAALGDKRDLGVHTGSMGEGMVALIEAGVVTNARKSIDRGITVATLLIGGATVRRFAHQNPALELRGCDYTHSQRVIAGIDRFVAINSAIEVDLGGQINSELAAGRYVGAVGGICDFLRGAELSPGGIPIVALRSTGGGRSRIVPAITGPVTVPRSDACVIVTEHGVADLRGLSLAERVPRLIAVAHPDHREALERASHAARRSC